MENREENRARDERLDSQIHELLSRHNVEQERATRVEQVVREFARLAAEESPRMSNAARADGLHMLRMRAAPKPSLGRLNPIAFLSTVPRWAQIGVVALLVVLAANGIGAVAADSL